MENITREHIEEIDDELAKNMITLGSRELTLANVHCIYVWCACMHARVCKVVCVALGIM